VRFSSQSTADPVTQSMARQSVEGRHGVARRIGGAGGGSDPGSGKSAGFVAAVVLAGAVAVGGLGGATTLGGSSGGGVVDSATAHNLSTKKAEGKKSARNGDANEAWRRMNMRTLKRAAKQDLQCLAHSFGQVREFFGRNPCKSLDRVLYGVGDDQGNTVVISVAWVSFRSRSDARAFKALDDVHGSGDVTPLASTLLELANIRFTGHHYQSRLNGDTVVIAETEVAKGQISNDVLDAVADVAVWLPHP
jgi:hypothetical protein